MRLIDADALKEAISKHPLIDFTDDDIFELIDNAPTIKDRSLEIAQKSIELGRKVGQLEGKLERPQGEWIEESSETGALGIKYTWVRCNQCGWNNSLVIPKNFCPICGAKMQKGGAE